MSDSPAGFALRINGTCGRSEVDCGITVAPYRVCCPGSSFCPSAYNPDCCPTPDNCTTTLLEEPKCANSSWDLYDNGGYFCCLRGLRGYATTRNSNGCAGPGHAFRSGETLLELISAGQDPSSSTTSSVRTSSSTSTETTTSATTSADQSSSTELISTSETISETGPDRTSESTSSKSSSTNVGAIAGGVVGGVVGLFLVAVVAWMVLKKRKKGNPTTLQPHEIDGTKQHHEIDGNEARPKIAELPARPLYEAPG